MGTEGLEFAACLQDAGAPHLDFEMWARTSLPAFAFLAVIPEGNLLLPYSRFTSEYHRTLFFAAPFVPCDCGAILAGWLPRIGSGIVRISAVHSSSPIRS